jgi:hypothetical protein
MFIKIFKSLSLRWQRPKDFSIKVLSFIDLPKTRLVSAVAFIVQISS